MHLKKHIEVQPEKNANQCNIFEAVYAQIEDFKGHMKMHTNGENHINAMTLLKHSYWKLNCTVTWKLTL